MEDLTSVDNRVFARLIMLIGEVEANRLVIPALNAYNKGEYSYAVDAFAKSCEFFPALVSELEPHLEICRRVLRGELDHQDHDYESTAERWRGRSGVQHLFGRLRGRQKPPLSIRCKYCARYTPFIHPYVSLLSGNECWRCGRSYPMPDFAWDGVDGQAYVYYRRSVPEELFYREFELRFDVSPVWRRVGGRPSLVEAPGNVAPDEIPSTVEGWGKRLGKDWLESLNEGQLEAIFEALVNDERSVQQLLPDELRGQRKSYISELARAINDEEEMVALDFDMAAEEVVCDAYLASLPGEDEDDGA